MRNNIKKLTEVYSENFEVNKYIEDMLLEENKKTTKKPGKAEESLFWLKT